MIPASPSLSPVAFGKANLISATFVPFSRSIAGVSISTVPVEPIRLNPSMVTDAVGSEPTEPSTE